MLFVIGAGSMVKMAVISHETTIKFGGSSQNEKYFNIHGDCGGAAYIDIHM